MAGLTYLLFAIFLVLILKETKAFFDPCSELKREIDHAMKINLKNELLVFQLQEQLENEIRGSEDALRSLKMAEEQCPQPKEAKPILHITLWLQLLVVILIMLWSGSVSRFERHAKQRITQLEHRNNFMEGQNYFLMKQLEAKEKILHFKTVTQEQMQTKIDDLRVTEETNNQTIKDLREEEKNLKATIDSLKKQLEENEEKGKNLKATIDDLTKILEPDICRHLLEAVKSVDVKTVKILCNYANDTCSTDDVDGNTPLTLAATTDHVEVVRLLLESGVNTERGNKFQRTALHRAALYGYMEVCRLLLDWGAQVDPLDIWKDTPLHDAARGGRLSVAKLLVERGADLRAKNDNGETASDVAQSKGKKDVAKVLDSESLRLLPST